MFKLKKEATLATAEASAWAPPKAVQSFAQAEQ
jgi:hypothetical protein